MAARRVVKHGESSDIILTECETTGVLAPPNRFHAHFGGVDGQESICKSYKDEKRKKGRLVDTRAEGKHTFKERDILVAATLAELASTSM
jgi:hypothetical protein